MSEILIDKLTPAQRKIYYSWVESGKSIRKSSEVKKVKAETAAQKKARLAFYFSDTWEGFVSYCNYYFNYNNELAPFGWFHKRAFEDLVVHGHRNNVWEWSREMAKSVFGIIFLQSWLLNRNWLEGLILASETEDKADKLIGDLENQLRNNQRLIADFGDYDIGGSWTNGYFYTKTGVGFWAFGVGQNPAGVREGFKRPNMGIVDDADSRKTAKNQTITKERVDWIMGEFMGCLQTKKRRFIYANNRVSRDGLTAHIVGDVDKTDKVRDGWNQIKVYWTENPTTHEMLLPEQGGVPAWSENYSLEDCKNKILDMGWRNALRQLYHKDEVDGDVFKASDIRWQEPFELHLYDQLIAYCDPSFSDTGDFKAIVLVGIKGRQVHILWAWVKQTTPTAMVSVYFDLYDQVNLRMPRRFFPDSGVSARQANCRYFIEGNIAQKIVLKPLFDQFTAERKSFFSPSWDERKKPDKRGRIESLTMLFERAQLAFNLHMKDDQDMQKLVYQFLKFPNGNDDGPDAVEGAIHYLEKSIATQAFRPEINKRVHESNW